MSSTHSTPAWTLHDSQWSHELEDLLRESAVAADKEQERLEDEMNKTSVAAKRLREEANRMGQQTKRCRRLYEKADRLDETRKLLQDGSLDAYRLENSLKFQAFCLALRRNDEAITVVECKYTFPHGYGACLGTALRYNTHVTSVVLYVDKLLMPMRQALSQNLERELAPLLEFIAQSTSVRRVAIHRRDLFQNSDVNQLVMELLFQAALSNREHIDTLIPVVQPNITTFERYMHNSKLHTFDVEFGSMYECDRDASNRLRIGQIFQQNATLRSLSVAADARLMLAILIGLSRNDGHQLSNLKVQCTDHFEDEYYDSEDEDDDGEDTSSLQKWMVLSQFLTSKVGPLNHLHLKSARLDGTSMAHFIVGLRGNGSTSVSKLTLENSIFDYEASDLFLSFMHTKIDTDKTESTLRELSITSGTFSRGGDDKGMASMLSMQPENQTELDGAGKWYATIGSQIQHFSVGFKPNENDPWHTSCHLLGDIYQHANQIQLQTLEVQFSNCEDGENPYNSHGIYEDLSFCIDSVSSLREVVVTSADALSEYGYLIIVESMKGNGNIHRIVLPQKGYSNEENIIYLRLAYAYADRNRLLGPLLQAMTAPEPANGEHSGTPSQRLNGQMSLGPALLEAATQIPSTKASMLYRALIQLLDSIGPGSGGSGDHEGHGGAPTYELARTLVRDGSDNSKEHDQVQRHFD